MGTDSLNWLKENDPEAYKAALEAEDQFYKELAERDLVEATDKEKLQKFVETGEIDEDDGSWLDVAKAIPETVGRFVSGQEHQLKPLRKAMADEGKEYYDPIAHLGQLYNFARQMVGKGEVPTKDAWVSDPRERYEGEYGERRPPIREDGSIDIDAIYSSDLPREQQNNLAIKATAHRTGLPEDKLKKFVKLRLGDLPEESEELDLAPRKLKMLGKIVDDALANAPTGIVTRVAKKLDPEFQKLLTLPKGKRYLSPATIKKEINPYINAIKAGTIDTVWVKGRPVDVEPEDTSESIERKVYRDEMVEAFSLLEDYALESRWSVASLFLPALQIGKAANGLSKAATIARRVEKSGKISQTVKGAARGFTKMAETTGVPTRSLTYIVRDIPGLKWFPHSKIAQAGDFLVTTAGTQAGLAALGAPEGMADERAAMAGIMTTPFAALIGVPGRVMQTARANKNLQLNKDLQRSVVKSEKFTDMPRIHQKMMRKAYGNSGAVRQFEEWRKYGKLLPQELKERAQKQGYTRLSTPEMLSNMVDDPAYVDIIDRSLLDAGYEHTPAGLERLRQLSKISKSMKDSFDAEIARVKDAPQSGQVLETRFKLAATTSKKLQEFLAENPSVVNNEAAFFDAVKKFNPGVSKEIKKRLSPENYRAAYQKHLGHLVEAGIFEPFSLKRFVELNRARTIHSTNPVANAIVKLYDADIDAKMQGKVAIQPKASYQLIMAEPKKTLPLIYDMVESHKAELLKAKAVPEQYRGTTKEYQRIQKEAMSELKKLQKEMNALGKVANSQETMLVKTTTDLVNQLAEIEKKMPPALFNDPSYQSIRKLIASSLESRQLVPEFSMEILGKHLAKITDSDIKAAVKTLTEEFVAYNKKKKVSKQYAVKYQDAVSKFFELDDAMKKVGESVDPKFRDVIAGLRDKDDFQAFGAIQKLIVDKFPGAAKLIEQVPEINTYIMEAASYIAKGEKIPAEVRQKFRSLAVSDTTLKEFAKRVGQARTDARVAQSIAANIKNF